MKRLMTCISLILATSTLWAAEKPWSNTTSLSFLNANGNTKSSTLGASNLFKWSRQKMGVELSAGALNTTSKGERTAEQYYAGEKMLYKIDDRNYAFEKYLWERNTFAGFAHRHDVAAGLGREWMKTEKNNFLTELGGGWVNEQRVRAERETFGSGRAYAKFAHVISPTAHFSQDAEYLHNFKDSDDGRLNTETALVSSVSSNLSLKVSYKWNFRNTPPPSFGRNDTLTSVSLIINY